VRVFNRRFATATRRLEHADTAVRLAGVYALAGLADDWQDSRQTCIDELCAYLRMPYEHPPEAGPPAAEQLSFGGSQEVHHTVISIITAHLRDNARVSWRGHDFDFTGVRFDGGDFSGAVFSGGTVDFREAVFSGGTLDFTGAVFSGATVDFTGARFSGAAIDFTGAEFSRGPVHFVGAEFSGGTVHFGDATFSGATVDFTDATFSGRRGGLSKDLATDPPAGLLLPPA
jgi:Pentapeptide repeats (9 copies)